MGEIMELIKDFLIIIGIFVCMSLGIFFLLHSGDAKKKTKQTVQDTRDSIQEAKFYQKNNRGMLTKLKYYL